MSERVVNAVRRRVRSGDTPSASGVLSRKPRSGVRAACPLKVKKDKEGQHRQSGSINTRTATRQARHRGIEQSVTSRSCCRTHLLWLSGLPRR